MSNIDLNKCVPGQKLRSKHGIIFTYVRRTSDKFYPHEVEYPNGGYGTRTDDGFVYRLSRLEGNHDIVEIIPLEGFTVSLEQWTEMVETVKSLSRRVESLERSRRELTAHFIQIGSGF